MTIRKKMVLPLALAGAALVMMAVASLASATHVRPKSAAQVRVAFVHAYNQCTAPTSTHGPPLAAPSCLSPTQTSPRLTSGTPDANGAPANFEGFGKLKVVEGVVGPPDTSNVDITIDLRDIRCHPGGAGNTPAACTAPGSANAAAGPDYTGGLEATATIRITDHDNGGGSAAGTVVDLGFPVPVPASACVVTVATTRGSDCAYTVGANTVVPGSVKTGKRGIVEVSQVLVNDGGADSDGATPGNSTFLRQGIFIP